MKERYLYEKEMYCSYNGGNYAYVCRMRKQAF